MSFWTCLAEFWLFNRLFGRKRHSSVGRPAVDSSPASYSPREYADDLSWAADDPDLEPDELDSLAEDEVFFNTFDHADSFDTFCEANCDHDFDDDW